MGASRFIGRVGGLALALGVGTAVLGGTAVSWADQPAPDSSSTQTASAHSARNVSPDPDSINLGSTRPTASSTHGGPSAAPRQAAQPAPVAETRPRGLGAARLHKIETADASEFEGAARSIETPSSAVDSSAPESPASAAIPGTLSAAPQIGTLSSNLVDQPITDDPITPLDSLELALATFARHQTAAGLPTAEAIPVVTPEEDIPVGHNNAVIMGPSGVPEPTEEYVQKAFDLYVAPNSPEDTTRIGLVTPEGLYPITGVKSLPLEVSVQQGEHIFKDELNLRQFAVGNSVYAFGYSQSAIISSIAMTDPDIDPGADLHFILVGNEMNPNGGFLSRFPDLDLPSLGIPFYGPTPENAFPTVNYTLEYDGFADFPKYPFNALSVLNAGLGIIFVHTKYMNETPEQIADAIELPTTSETQKYYILPTKNLPLLEPIRLIPVIGNPIADLLQPALRVIVNLGYGDPKYGWTNTGFANEQQTFAVFPQANWIEVAQLFVAGIKQGIQDFIQDIMPDGIFWQELKTLTSPHHDSADSPTSIIEVLQDTVNSIGRFISNSAASLYSALLPTADIVNAFVTVLPTHDISLFLGGIQQALHGEFLQGIVNAICLPIAADVGLGITALLIELLVIAQAVTGVFTGVIQ